MSSRRRVPVMTDTCSQSVLMPYHVSGVNTAKFGHTNGILDRHRRVIVESHSNLIDPQTFEHDAQDKHAQAPNQVQQQSLPTKEDCRWPRWPNQRS